MPPKTRHCADCKQPFEVRGGVMVRCYPCRSARLTVVETVNRLMKKAIRVGQLKKQPCEICGSRKSEGHHDDYGRPLKVRWLCRQHHKNHHVAQKWIA